jgi:tetratricopeptide (TPR) repeat protein
MQPEASGTKRADGQAEDCGKQGLGDGTGGRRAGEQPQTERLARTQQAKSLLKQGQHQELVDLLDSQEAAGVRPSAALTVLKARAYAALGQPQRAQQLLARRFNAGNATQQVKQAYAEILLRNHEYRAAIEVLESEPVDLDGRGQFLLAKAYQGAGHSEQAEHLLQKLCSGEAPDPQVVLEYANILYWKGQGKLESDESIRHQLARIFPQCAGPAAHICFIRLDAIYRARRDASLRAALHELVVSKDISLDNILRRCRTLPAATWGKVIDTAENKASGEYPNDFNVWLLIAQCRHDQGLPDRCRTAFVKAVAAIGSNEELLAAEKFASVAGLHDLVTRVDQARLRKQRVARSGQSEEDWKNLLPDGSVRVTTFGTSRAFVAFANITLDNRATMEPLIAGLRQRDIALVQVRDTKRQLYINGFGPYYPSREQAFESLRGILSDNGYEQTTTIGFSSGGYAAIRYGLEIGARGALLLSGVTTLSDAWETRAHSTLRRVTGVRLPDYPDLLPILEKNTGFVVHSYYPTGSDPDRLQALHLAGLPRARIFGIGQIKHMVWAYWTPERWGEVLDLLLQDAEQNAVGSESLGGEV